MYGWFNNVAAILLFLPEDSSNDSVITAYSTLLYGNIHEPFFELPQEITLFTMIVLLGVAFYSLQSFVRKYALSMVDHENEAQKLTKMNDDLKAQLQRYFSHMARVESSCG